MLQIAPDNNIVHEATDDDVIVCANCNHPITRARWRITKNEDNEHTVFNPGGQVFRIACFKEAIGVYSQGPPSSEFTWFKGYSWQVGRCAGCSIHLGWRYTGGDTFFGLIKDQLKDLNTLAK